METVATTACTDNRFLRFINPTKSYSIIYELYLIRLYDHKKNFKRDYVVYLLQRRAVQEQNLKGHKINATIDNISIS